MIIFLLFSSVLIISILLLLFEGFLSGWSIDLNQWDDLPNDGEIIDRR